MLETFPDPFLGEIYGQPAAIRRAAQGLRRQEAQLMRIPRLQPGSPVVFTGMGGSYATCYAPVTSLGSQGMPAVMVDSAELLYFRRPMLKGSALLVVVSQSGESAEVVRLAEHLDGDGSRPCLVSITNGLNNRLARFADVALDTGAGPEQGPSTMTFGCALVLLAALSGILASGSVPQVCGQVAGAAEDAAAWIEHRLERAESDAERLTHWLGKRSILTLLGRGSARAASEMGALTLKEAPRFPAEAMEAAQFRHGPLELAGGETAAVLISTEPATSDLDARLADELADSGVAVLWIGTTDLDRKDVERVAIGPIDRQLAPAVAIVPVQLLSWRLAVQRGFRPGTYSRASKVTRRE